MAYCIVMKKDNRFEIKLLLVCFTLASMLTYKLSFILFNLTIILVFLFHFNKNKNYSDNSCF